MLYLLIFLFNLIASFFLIKIFIYYCNFFKIVDEPKNLAIHKVPTPTSCGILFCAIFLFNFLLVKKILFFESYQLNKEYIFFLNIILLTFLSFIDDIRGIHPIYRIIIQLVCVMSSLSLLSPDLNNFLNFLPNKLVIFSVIFYWVYLINISNFLDGSDGYLTVNAIGFFLGIISLTLFKGDLLFLQYVSLFMLPILLGFLFYNKNPARIFMGDSGSILIGYLFGLCSLILILNNYWYIAITLLCYPFLDISLTILRKIKNKIYPWERLFDYFFLRALFNSNYNHQKILNITIIYNLIIYFLVLLQIFFDLKYLFIFAILGALIKIKKFHSIIS